MLAEVAEGDGNSEISNFFPSKMRIVAFSSSTRQGQAACGRWRLPQAQEILKYLLYISSFCQCELWLTRQKIRKNRNFTLTIYAQLT